MTLRVRVTLWIGLLVVFTAMMAWAAYRPTVLKPVAEELFDARIARAVNSAERIEAGEPPANVEEKLSVDLRFDVGPADGPPQPPTEPPEGDSNPPFRLWGPPSVAPPHGGSRGWTRLDRPGRVVWYRSGPQNEVAARSGDRWVVLHDHNDLALERRLLAALLLGGLPIVIGASWIASRTLRPVESAERAMVRIADGDLGHRLDEREGPPELRRIAAIFNRMAVEVERRVRAERQLMAGLSHEIRTPLTRMRLELELARRAGGDTGRITRLDAEVAEVDLLVTELLDLSRLEVGQVALHREEVDLRGLIDELIGADPDRIVLKGDATAEVDPRLLRRAVQNLIANSRRHAPGATVHVTVAPDRVVVEDDGPGMPEEELARLFQPFWRGAGARSTGHGLGLAIVRQIALLHEGEVRAERGAIGLRVILSFGHSPSRAESGRSP